MIAYHGQYWIGNDAKSRIFKVPIPNPENFEVAGKLQDFSFVNLGLTLFLDSRESRK